MKKILSILATTSLVASTSVAVVSCNTKQNSDFKIPKFPTNVDEAKKIILDLSKEQAVSQLKIEEMEEQEVSEVEIINFRIKNKFLENEAIIVASAFKIKNEEGVDAEIKVWTYNNEKVLEETSMLIGDYIDFSTELDENYYFSETVDGLISTDISVFPESVVGVKEMINNMKEVKKWWLEGRNLKSFSEQFKLEKVLLVDNEDKQEALKAAVALSKNNDITVQNTKFVNWYSNEAEEKDSFSIVSINNNEYLGYALFKFAITS
ncbi:lipoprotein [Spiroplasma endosymbiont of Dioctria linearis]|uniref:lipoprotein n=1 Tax=Spiroplasma endosymbiont of Dioctria linearis TaxID=3066290 RepID=UPI00313E3FD2